MRKPGYVPARQLLAFNNKGNRLISQRFEVARVSKTFLYDPRHADLAEEIRRLRELPTQQSPTVSLAKGKSDGAKDARIVRFKERVQRLEQQVRELQQENELLYGKLADREIPTEK